MGRNSQKFVEFSIITPTLCRFTLKNTVESLKCQTYKHFKHIIVTDGEPNDAQKMWLNTLYDQKRYFRVIYSEKTRNFGNTQRRLGWKWATGDYILYIDDDDAYCNKQALEILATALKNANYPEWAVFNAYRIGKEFLHDPPALANTMSCQFVHKRLDAFNEPIIWLDVPANSKDYHWDGKFIETLKRKYQYKIFRTAPLVRVHTISYGQ